jgi:replicative DNA helicase
MTDALTRFREQAQRLKGERPQQTWAGDEMGGAGAGVQVPPHSMEAEQSVLGALLIDNLAFDRIADLVDGADFYRHEHRRIFDAIAALIHASKTADVVTVFEHLQRSSAADAVGGMAYLNALAQSVPSANHARQYAAIVRERATRRALIAAADEAGSVARDDTHTVAEGLDRIDRLLDRVRGAQVRKGPVQLSALLIPLVDRVNELFENRNAANGLIGMPTGIPKLNAILSGLQPGKLYCIGARPMVGKSSGGRQIGIAAAEAGFTTLVLSMEMPGSEIAACVMSQLGRIESDRLQRGDLEPEDWSRLTEATERGAKLPLYVDDEGGLTLPAIRNKARMVKGLRLLVIDYLQLSVSTLRGATTNDQIAEVSKGLKALALSMGIAIVLLSQLNRDVERRQDKEPQLSDLRDSGAIEQDADVVILLWTAREFDGGATRVVGWKVAKHRGGPRGRFAMRFDAARYAWTDAPTTALDAPAQPAGKVFE